MTIPRPFGASGTNHEVAEVELDKLLVNWQKKHGLKDFEVVDMVLRHGLNLYLRGQCHDYANDIKSK